MKKLLYLFLLLPLLTNSCLRVTDYEALGNGNASFVDSNLTTPVFSNQTFTPTQYNGEFSFAKSHEGMALFYTYSGLWSGKAFVVGYDGTTFTPETTLVSLPYSIGPIDGIFDHEYYVYRSAYGSDAGGWPPVGTVSSSSWNYGSTPSFDIESIAADFVRIVRAGNQHYVIIVSNPASTAYYKKIDYSGTFAQTVTPSYTGTFNSLFYHDTDNDVYEILTAYNKTTGDAIVGWSWLDGGSNCFRTIKNDGSFYGGEIVSKAYGSSAHAFGMTAFGDKFLIAYESNLNIDEQNSGNYEITGEHVRLVMMNGNGQKTPPNINPVSDDAAYFVLNEKSMAIPQLIGTSNQVTAITVAGVDDATEAGLAYVRDGYLYFTRVIFESNQLRMAPLRILASGVNSSIKLKSVNYDGVFYIIASSYNSFTIYKSL